MLRFSLARIVAVVVSDDFGFLAITIATLGLAIGAVLSHALRIDAAGLSAKLGSLSIATSGLALASAVTSVSSGFSSGALPAWLGIAALTLPFIAAGIVIAASIALGMERIGSVFAFGFVGAAGASIGHVPLLHGVGAPNTVLASAVVFAAAGAIWFSLGGQRIGRILAVSIGLFFTLLVMVNAGFHLIDVRYSEGRRLVERPFVKWNTWSRVSLTPLPGGTTGISVNGRPAQPIASAETASPAPFLAAKTLVIEPGGGADIAAAVASGSTDVTGVEVSSAIGDIVMQKRFPDLSNRLYHRPEVHIYIEEGLAYIRRTNEKFALIKVNKPIDEAAFDEYRAHLTPGGTLVATRRQQVTDFTRFLAPGIFLLLAVVVAGMKVRGTALLFIPFFLLIGAAGMLLTARVRETFALLIGHPTYGWTIVLFVFFLAAAFGSFNSLRREVDSRTLLLLLGLLGLVLVAGSFLLRPLLLFAAPLPLAVRILLAVAIVTPSGIVAGLPLPVGCRVLTAHSEDAGRVMWALFFTAAIFATA
jgi:hypothetical protein